MPQSGDICVAPGVRERSERHPGSERAARQKGATERPIKAARPYAPHTEGKIKDKREKTKGKRKNMSIC